jgi:hypothetical protein
MQFSLAYIGAIVATAFSSNLSIMESIHVATNIDKGVLISGIFLFLNLSYLILATSWTFAIIKRGLFLLRLKAPQQKEIVEFEIFLRRTEDTFTKIGWNVDNYYVAFLYFLVFMSSAGLFWFAFVPSAWARGAFGQTVLLVLFLAHALPAWFAWQTFKVMQACDKVVKQLS